MQTPLRVCYVVSYSFESGAERQALAQGSELARRGHTVHVVTKAIPGYPVRDEEHRGVFIHRWVKTTSGGPIFALSFLSGVIRALASCGVRSISFIRTRPCGKPSRPAWHAHCCAASPCWCNPRVPAITARPTSSGEPAAPAF